MPSSSPPSTLEFPKNATLVRKISEKGFGSLLQVKMIDGSNWTVSTDAVGLMKGDKLQILSGTPKYWDAGKQWQLTKCKVDVVFDRIPESTLTTQLLVKGLRKLFIKNVKGFGKVAADKLCNSGTLERLTLAYLDGARKEDLGSNLVHVLRGTAMSKLLSRCINNYSSAHVLMVESVFLALGNIRSKADEVPDLKRFIDCLLTKPYSEMTLDALGFLKCDDLATQLDLHRTPQRLEAALCHCLSEVAKSDGHCYLPREELFTKTKELMNIPRIDASEALERCVSRGATSSLVSMLLGDVPIVYRRRIFTEEMTVARMLRSLSQRNHSVFSGTSLDELRVVEGRPSPAPDQRAAMETIMSRSVSILTGPPGSGKSLTVRWLTELAGMHGRSVQLLAPTGRASARLREVCDGGDATTIHMWMLRKNVDPVDLIVVDETSMVDVDLLLKFLNAVKSHHPTATLIFVGDVDQLPSIGAGNVLLDLISSGSIPVAQLTHIHRQGSGSGILRLAFAVRAGDLQAVRECRSLPECNITLKSNEDEVLDMVLQMCMGPGSESLQVITPCKMGTLGTDSINRSVQQALNPNIHVQGKFHKVSDGLTFAVGDKIIACKNNHTRGIYNGDIGRVDSISSKTMSIMYATGKLHEYDLDDEETATLSLAYAITVHRTQGSEFARTLILMPHSAWKMANQRLLYTAVTRSKQSCAIYGIKDILVRAVCNQGTPRYTRLGHLLM